MERLRADGQQAHQAGDYRRALYSLDKALELSTHSLAMKTTRAECLAFLGRYSEVGGAVWCMLYTDTYYEWLSFSYDIICEQT